MGCSFAPCFMNTTPKNVGECPVRISRVTMAIFMIFLGQDDTLVRSRQFPSLSLPSRYSLISLKLHAPQLHLQIARTLSMVWCLCNSNSVSQYSETNVIHFLFNLLGITGRLHASSITCSSSGGATHTALGILRAYVSRLLPGLKWI
jgi:hypothetical protein